MNCCTYPGANCDTDHQLLMATLKVRLAKRQRRIPPLNLRNSRIESNTVCSRVDRQVYGIAGCTDEKVTTEDLWKGTKTALLEAARETIGCVKSQKKKKWLFDETFAAIRGKREARQR